MKPFANECDTANQSSIPKIYTSENGVLMLSFKWKEYEITEFDEKNVPNELKKSWALWWSRRNEGILEYYNVPQKFLPYALAHEAMCPIIGGSWHCCTCVKEELKLIPEEIKKEYIDWRINFFKWMYRYFGRKMKECESFNDGRDFDDYECYKERREEMSNSLDVLQSGNISLVLRHIKELIYSMNY